MTNVLTQSQAQAEASLDVSDIPDFESVVVYFRQLSQHLRPDNREQTSINDHGHSYAMFVKDVARELVLNIIDKLLDSPDMTELRELLQEVISEPYSLQQTEIQAPAYIAYVATDLQEILQNWNAVVSGTGQIVLNPKLASIATRAYTEMQYYASRQAITLLGESLVLDPELYLQPLLGEIAGAGFRPAEIAGMVNLVKADGLIKRRFQAGQELDPITNAGLEHLLISAHNREAVSGSSMREKLETANLLMLQQLMLTADPGSLMIEWSDPYHQHQVRTMVRIHQLQISGEERQWHTSVVFVPFAADGYVNFQEQILQSFNGQVISDNTAIPQGLSETKQQALGNLVNMVMLPPANVSDVMEYLPLAETVDDRPRIDRLISANDELFDRATRKFHKPLNDLSQQILRLGVPAAISGDPEQVGQLASQLQATIHTARLTTLPKADLRKAGLGDTQIDNIRNSADRLTQLASHDVTGLHAAINEISPEPFTLTNITSDCVRDNYAFGSVAPSAPKVVSSMSGVINESGRERSVQVQLVEAAGANGESIYYLKQCPKCNRQQIDICTNNCKCGFPISKLVEVCSSPDYQGNRSHHISKLLQREVAVAQGKPQPALAKKPTQVQPPIGKSISPQESGFFRSIFDSMLGMYLPFSMRGINDSEA